MTQWTIKTGIADTRRELARIPTAALNDLRNVKSFTLHSLQAAIVSIVENPLLNLLRLACLIGAFMLGFQLVTEVK